MRVVICDDEPEVASAIGNLLQAKYPTLQTDIYTSAEALLAAFDKESPFDAAILDIMMPGMNGLSLAYKLREEGCTAALIFLTGNDTQVYDAFKVSALRYLLKPIDEENLYEAMDAAIQNKAAASAKKDSSIFIKHHGTLSKIAVEDIVFAEIYNRKITLHTIHEDIQYYGKMSDLLAELGDGFYQPHRSYVVNLNYVESYQAHQITLYGGATAMISKTKYAEFVRTYAHFIRR